MIKWVHAKEPRLSVDPLPMMYVPEYSRIPSILIIQNNEIDHRN